MMITLNYSRLYLLKQFRKYHCGQFIEHGGCGHKFYEAHVNGPLFDLKPTFNPLEKAIFYDTKRQYDIYYANMLHASRGFLVKPHVYELFKEFHLAEHVAYHGITREFEGVRYDDLVFVYFYRDYGSRIDYVRSVYWVLKPHFSSYNRETESIYDYVVEDNIRLSDENEYKTKKRIIKNKYNFELEVKYLHCPEATRFDVFGFEDYESGVYVSGRVVEKFKKQKIRGLDYASNMYFQFIVYE
jgi:hypothetical protein